MTEVRRRPGRPKDVSKRDALLDAGRRLLLDRGPEVTTEEIAFDAGVSKSTLYANFSGKEDLIEAVLHREAERTITDDDFASLFDTQISAATIIELGLRYVRFVNSRDLLRWDRVIASLEASNPGVAGKFFALGPGRAQRLLETMLEKAVAEGIIRVGSVRVAADQLAGLWLGFSNLEIKLGVRPELSDREIREQVEAGVNIFMQYYSVDRECCSSRL